MTRRQFGSCLLASSAAMLVGAWRYGNVLRVRFVRAAKGTVFPGRLVPFDSEQAGKPGPWLG